MSDSQDKGKAPERKDKPEDADASDTSNGTPPPQRCPLESAAEPRGRYPRRLEKSPAQDDRIPGRAEPRLEE